MKKTAALVLAAGRGTRMHSEMPKQFLKVGGKPLFLHSVEKMLLFADPVIVVVSPETEALCGRFLKEYGLADRVTVCTGGAERWLSSVNGLSCLKALGDAEQVLIHDAARALVTEEVILRVISETERYGASIAAVPSKDTVKTADENGFVKETPDRKKLWIIQTPQGFKTEWIREAYEKMLSCLKETPEKVKTVTDDAMVMENFSAHPVKLTMGDYGNLKLTTPEDLKLFEAELKK